MKSILSTILFLTIQFNSFATEWNWFYIYVQTEYVQGSWLRADVLDKSNYQYLQTKQFEELFGSEGSGLAESIIDHLEKETPERYKFKYTVSVLADTVTISTKDSIQNFDAVKNELTASLIMNNFNTVKIVQNGKASIFHLEDITVPYMDLVFPSKIKTSILQNKDSIQEDSIVVDKHTGSVHNNSSDNKMLIALSISIIINLILVALLLRRKSNN